MPFKKGNTAAKDSKPLRRDMTLALIANLNDVDTFNTLFGEKRREFIDRIVENLVLHAAWRDYVDKEGNKRRDIGDLAAILAIIDRLEGKPAQKIVGPNNGPVKIQFNTIEEVKAYLLERGIDVERLPNPMKYLEPRRRSES